MKVIFLVLILLLTINIYPQTNREQALAKGGWSGGLAGWVGWENYDVSESLEGISSKSKVDVRFV